MIKWLKKISGIVVVVAILFVATYTYLLSDFNGMFKNEKFIVVSNDIKRVKDDRELMSIIAIYNTIHRGQEKFCPCKQATHYIKEYNIFRPSISRTIYSLRLHKDYDEDSCLKFLLLHREFLYGIDGVKEASEHYYKKSLSQISEEQIMRLVIMFENPSFYSPERNEEAIQKKMKRYQSFVSNKNNN